MYIDLSGKTVYAINWDDESKLEKFMEENGIEYETFSSDYVNFCCPNCGDSDFWDGSHCNHCGH